MAGAELPTPRADRPDTQGPGLTGCGSCAFANAANLTKLGVDPGRGDYIAAVAGNPNTGKSTVFNALTGLRQHVGNWPGKTVARAEGSFQYRDYRYTLVDLPGTYSLLSTSGDEDIARDFLLFGRPDVTIVVVDATRLERNLNLVLQILQITDRVVVALNLMDEAGRHGITIDVRHLARELGVPVVPTSARNGTGLPELLESVEQVANGTVVTKGVRVQQRDARLERAVSTLARRLADEFPGLDNTRWVALRLLEGDPSIERAVRDGTLGGLGHGARLAGAAEEAS
ncbi:FeoB small GTPase domain-containing protein [Haloechinothrix salitolerans]|uniref:FeoB small GTPase domain-containing protein n=1 Tax=Haloechinothrix salitolerans TaxID=926830 RepID=A0ABW2C653_9PSEU